MIFTTAPAKVNLFLAVLGKRPDGYHEIDTLFEKISIFDNITVDITPGNTVINCSDPSIPVDGDSLLGRTIREFKDKTGKKTNFNVNVEKNIPVSAGLGGGSSDAAALLRALNNICGNPLQETDLLAIARQLGADVPFFIKNYAFARGSGRGDIIEEVKASYRLSHIVIKPPYGISTREVYGKVSSFDLTNKMTVDRMMTAFSSGENINSIVKNLRNDLQTIVLRDFPDLEKIFSELKKAGALGVLLSGSGPSVFGIFQEDKITQAERKIRGIFLPEDNWQVFVAKTC
ncbi:MAG: 4-(cytidine 5'-diphospho)-2-C-methyl-D-erythritol kinase [Candidatus Omnitrophica bacterium]|nr:4-(cytidine 5'-diphospho)-2-C-methyl-D-erythritol kinase [Candidatus Omnitrophota bacterium]